MSRLRRRAGLGVLALGIALVVWAGSILIWGEPFTSLYTMHEQGTLSHQLDRTTAAWRQTRAAARKAAEQRSIDLILARLARRFGAHLTDGEAIGRIVIPRIGLNMVVVQGTDETDLEKGPGHYDTASRVNTALPGAGGVVAIAGHRTTYLQPFRHIDELRPGTNVYLLMPYGTFRYQVYFHKIVLPNDWSILRTRRFEKLVLTACDPIYSASHRWVTFARLTGESVRTTFRQQS